jgi:hypothetical protein
MTTNKGQSREQRIVLRTLRAICSGLPESIETTTFGHPTFQAGKKRTFVVLDDHEQAGILCLVFKADCIEQAGLIDGVRFFTSKFGAKHGWTAMRVDARTDWNHAKRLVVASYRRVALKRMVAALDLRSG